jgi:hypothetical protein
VGNLYHGRADETKALDLIIDVDDRVPLTNKRGNIHAILDGLSAEQVVIPSRVSRKTTWFYG